MRDNNKRLGVKKEEDSVASSSQSTFGLNFVTPTEFVELPSKGLLYPPNHPLYKQKVIEIKQMTAKEEDILTSESLIKNGLVLSRFIESVIVDENIDPLSILSCDRNAIVVWSRIYGYGREYQTGYACPSCSTKQKTSFDLIECMEKSDEEEEPLEGVEISESGNLVVTLPATGWRVECNMLNGYSEKKLQAQQKTKKKKDFTASSQLKLMIKSIEGEEDAQTILRAVEVMPAKDSLHLRRTYTDFYPTLDLRHEFVCGNCDFSQEVEVPITADFFWIK
jgi:hypothetical protein